MPILLLLIFLFFIACPCEAEALSVHRSTDNRSFGSSANGTFKINGKSFASKSYVCQGDLHAYGVDSSTDFEIETAASSDTQVEFSEFTVRIFGGSNLKVNLADRTLFLKHGDIVCRSRKTVKPFELKTENFRAEIRGGTVSASSRNIPNVSHRTVDRIWPINPQSQTIEIFDAAGRKVFPPAFRKELDIASSVSCVGITPVSPRGALVGACLFANGCGEWFNLHSRLLSLRQSASPRQNGSATTIAVSFSGLENSFRLGTQALSNKPTSTELPRIMDECFAPELLDLTWYQRSLVRELKYQWTVKNDESRRAICRITISREGRLLNYSMISPSNSTIFDRSVFDAVNAVKKEPLPCWQENVSFDICFSADIRPY